MEAIEVQQGLLVQRAHSLYSFSHLTLQEYLAACYYLRSETISLLVEHLFDPRWREIFLLMAGMTRSDDLLLRMADLLITKRSEITCTLWRWARDSTLPTQDAGLEFDRRTRAIFIGLGLSLDLERTETTSGLHSKTAHINRAFELARELGSEMNNNALAQAEHLLSGTINKPKAQARELYTTFTKRLPELNIFKPELVGHALNTLDRLRYSEPHWESEAHDKLLYASQIIRSLFGGFGMPSDVQIWLTPDDATALEDDLYSVRLILQCKAAAFAVSKIGWETVLRRLLETK